MLGVGCGSRAVWMPHDEGKFSVTGQLGREGNDAEKLLFPAVRVGNEMQ